MTPEDRARKALTGFQWPIDGPNPIKRVVQAIKDALDQEAMIWATGFCSEQTPIIEMYKAEARVEEREACAKVAENGRGYAGELIAAAIRGRK